MSTLKLRKPVRSHSQLLASSTLSKKKRRLKSKPPWDSTVKDLSVFKPSPQELKRNHEMHQPKKDHERLIQKINSSRYLLDDYNCDNEKDLLERKKALIKEVFYNQEKELQDVLSETDRTLADVKDIFGDDVAQKFKGKPTITKAPQQARNSHCFPYNVEVPSQSYYDELSASIMRNPALNEISDDNDNGSDYDDDHNGGEYDDDDDDHSNIVAEYLDNDQNANFKSNIDLKRYKNLLTTQDLEEHPTHQTQIPDLKKFLSDKSTTTENSTKKRSKNHLQREEKTTKRISNQIQNTDGNTEHHKGVSPTIGAMQSFQDLKQMLNRLEKEISDYEKQSGRKDPTAKFQVPSTLTGYTTNLLSAVIRIIHHLKESELQLRAEMSMRKEILDAFEEQRNLVDALTADLLETQEANEVLKNEFEIQKKHSQTQYAHLKIDIKKLETKLDIVLSSLQKPHHENEQKMNIMNANNPLNEITNLKIHKETCEKGISPAVSPIPYHVM